MITNIYIDGFNFYYGAVKGTPYKWLNFDMLCRIMLPRHQIKRIKYFTALVNPRPHNPDQRVRQETYLRALATIPNLTTIFGYFLTHEVTMPLAGDKGGYAKVIKTEEKGSDVNIATHLLVDGFKNDYDVAVVVSNDSDLLLPIQFVIEELHKPVGILNPQKHPSVELSKYATFVKHIRPNVLMKCQFPSTLNDSEGVFSKPAKW